MEGSESCSLATHKRKKVVRCLWSLRAVPWRSFATPTTDNSSSSTDNGQQSTIVRAIMALAFLAVNHFPLPKLKAAMLAAVQGPLDRGLSSWVGTSGPACP